MEEKFTYFLKGPLSQWFKRTFVVQGVEYNCCEQFMMAMKAAVFDDQETGKRIMETKIPREQKDLGREVKNFNVDTWNAIAPHIVEVGNYAKFNQHHDLRKILFETRGTTLVEVNPEDSIWGIGLAEGDPLTFDRSTWKGKNWLGEVLTRVRERLLKLPENY